MQEKLNTPRLLAVQGGVSALGEELKLPSRTDQECHQSIWERAARDADSLRVQSIHDYACKYFYQGLADVEHECQPATSRGLIHMMKPGQIKQTAKR